jgi:glycosyltransferase involved in cell wall biosynthesis
LTDIQLTVGFPYPRQPGSWSRVLPYILRARGVVAKNKPGVLLSGEFYTLWATLFLRTAQTPVYSLWQGEYDFSGDFSVRKWLRYGAARADRLLASEPVAIHANHTGLLPRPVEILNPPVDEERFNPTKFDRATIRHKLGWSADQHVAPCAARLGDGKGQLWLATEFLSESSFPTSSLLVFAGPGECPSLLRLAASSGGRIQLLGPRDDIHALLAACDLAIQPGTLAESFGMAALEAVMMEKNLLAFDVGALPFTLGTDYPGLSNQNDKSGLIRNWLSLARCEKQWLPAQDLRRNLANRFGRIPWNRRAAEIFC